MGTVAGVAGVLALPPDLATWASAHRPPAPERPFAADDEYDRFAKLHFNENPYGPPASVMQAMTLAFKYSNRYGYPDPGVRATIAKLHGVSPDMVLLASGSGELLGAVGHAFLGAGKVVIGAEPTFSDVYEYASRVKCEAVKIPLRADHTQDIAATVRAATARARDVGFVYLCNPNNPTGRTVPATEVTQLLDGESSERIALSLGQSDVKTTKRSYIQGAGDELRRVEQAASRLLDVPFVPPS